MGYYHSGLERIFVGCEKGELKCSDRCNKREDEDRSDHEGSVLTFMCFTKPYISDLTVVKTLVAWTTRGWVENCACFAESRPELESVWAIN